MEDDWIRTALFVDADNVNVEVVAEVIRRLEAGGARRLQHRRVYGSLQKAQEFALLCQQHAMRFVCTTYAGTNGTCYGMDDKSTKLVYFSPVFAGFQFAASFTPDNTEDTRNFEDGAGTRFRNDLSQNSENMSLAGTFNHDFNGVTLVAGGGGTFSFNKETNPNDTDDARAYNAYAQVAFSGFTLGVASEMRENFGDDAQVRRTSCSRPSIPRSAQRGLSPPCTNNTRPTRNAIGSFRRYDP